MILGKRVRLREIERPDRPKFQEWLNNPEVTEGLSRHLPLSLTEEERWFQMVAQTEPEQQPLTIEVRDGDS